MKKIDVTSSKSVYTVYIQNHLLGHLKEYLEPSRQYVIISDSEIPEMYITKVKNACKNPIFLSFPAGESSKSLAVFEELTEKLLDLNIKKDACLIALGGGVTGDLVGFIASVYMRGIDFIQIPTTLLSQIDSSVGGKVAINSSKGKNVIGSFYPPIAVFIDPTTLDTLSDRQKSNGMAEMIKYGMIADKELFYKIKNEDVYKNFVDFIYRSLLIKKSYVEKDEFDNGLRQSLNFGHTFGHAIESFYNYQKYLHGEAVSIGMVMVLSKNDVRKDLVEVLKKYHLPTEDSVELSKLKEYINRDKKNRGELLNIVDVLTIGESVITKSTFQL